MEWVGIAIAILFILITAKNNKKLENDSYEKIEQLFTKAERSFLGVLEQAVGEEMKIYGKVRIADVIKPKKNTSRSQWQKAFNRISSKHLDFILCNKSDLKIICAIELDDKSHNSMKNIKRDKIVNNACKSANMPILRIKAKHNYSINEIREKIAEMR